MTATLTYIPDILEEHLEEIQVLLGLRAKLLRSPDAFRRNLAQLDERLLAHLDGVNAVGENALPPLDALLASDDPAAIHAASFALLHADVQGTLPRLADSFGAAAADRLLAIGDSLVLGPAVRAVEIAQRRVDDADPLAAIVSWRALARHTARRPASTALSAFAQDPSPIVRREAWRVAGEAAIVMDPKTYAAAMRDEDHAVVREAMLTAALRGIPGILTITQMAAEKPAKEEADTLRLLAVLGGRDDEKRIRYVGTDASLGPLRFEILGLFGAPSHIPLLLDAMGGEDARAAVAAGAAFRRMTGVDIDSSQNATLPPEDGSTPDEFEAEFLDEALLPDPARAREAWDRLAPNLDNAHRICAGLDATAALSAEQMKGLDLDTAWWQGVRAKFLRHDGAGSIDLAAFPFRDGA